MTSSRLTWWTLIVIIALAAGLAVTAVAVASLTVDAARAHTEVHTDLCELQAELLARSAHPPAPVITGC